MSLLITSSQSKDNTNAISIERPERYTNHLKNPLTIPPNSEIAVDSVKINRNPLIDMSDHQKSMFWFGQRLTRDQTTDDVCSWPILQENTVGRSVAPAELVEQYVEMLREGYAYHPNIDTSSTKSASLMSLVNTAGSLEGFSFQFQQSSSHTKSTPGNEDVFNVFGRTGMIYNSANGSITAGADDTLALVAGAGTDGGPISLMNGSVTFNVSDTRSNGADANTRQYVVGLVRAYNHPNYTQAFEDMGLDAGTGMGEDNDIPFDYCAEGKDGVLKLYHFVRNGDAVSGFEGDEDSRGAMTEIVYYSKTTPNNASNSSFATASPINVSEVTELTFTCEGEKLSVADQNGSIIVAVNKSVLADQTDVSIPKPINQACWKMYPQVYLYEDEDIIAVKNYSYMTTATMSDNVFYGPSNWNGRCLGNFVGHDDKKYGPAWENSFFWPRVLEQRSWGFTSDNSPSPKTSYKGVSTGTLDDMENIFIVGKAEKYLRDLPTNLWQSNIAPQLGMSPYSIFPAVTGFTSGLGSSFSSTSPPETSSQSSAFIRIPRLSHESFNAAVGSQSQILSMIPRFDNAGNDSGALFFQVPEKVYLDLNNSYPIHLTDITVDVVRKDETFVEDLTGSTDVVFHIRRKQKM